MSDKINQTETPLEEEVLEEQAEETAQPQEEAEAPQEQAQTDDRYLRLAAEYDNYRKRTAKEKEALWSDAKADTAAAFLPV